MNEFNDSSAEGDNLNDFFIVDENGMVTELHALDVPLNTSHQKLKQILNLPNTARIVTTPPPNSFYKWNGKQWVQAIETLLQELRARRDDLLANSDKLGLVDYQFKNDQEKQGWYRYRQQLRDLPKHAKTLDFNALEAMLDDETHPKWPQLPETPTENSASENTPNPSAPNPSAPTPSAPTPSD